MRTIFLSSILFSLLTVGLVIAVFSTQISQENRSGAQEAPTPPIVGDQAKLNDFWKGSAEWKYIAKYNYDYRNATALKILNGVWYIFYRGDNGNVSQACKEWLTVGLNTQVVRSYDQGRTWSEPALVVDNNPGKPWECSGADGDAFYDSEQNKWHYLFQCGAPDRKWHLCHLERGGQDPMGPFVETHPNPVVHADQNELWSRICNDSSKECYQIARQFGGGGVFDAGTPDIFEKRDGYYYFGFHGASSAGDKVLGYRGIAKTQDFINWIVADPSQGVPADAIFNRNDMQNWREDWQGFPSGGGAGNILYENGYYYLIVEAPSQSIGCVVGQNWDAGLLRSNSLTSTNWEQYPKGNPIIYSNHNAARPAGCPLQYQRILKDPVTGKVYMHFSIQDWDDEERGVYLYELVKTNKDFMKNGDLWKCNLDGWLGVNGTTQPTNMGIYRSYKKSTNGACSLVSNCYGGSCEPGQSVYQDIAIPPLERDYIYGGNFASEVGEGEIELVIFELSSKPEVLAEHKERLSLNGDYKNIEKSVRLNPATTKVRFQYFMNKPVGYKADEMFFKATSPYSLIDYDQNSSLDIFDYAIFVESFTDKTNPGDLNHDTKIDIFDYTLFLDEYFSYNAL